MGKPDSDRKTGIEGWIDERIQLALAGLTHPFEKRISRLRERIQKLQARVRQISLEIGENPAQRQGGRKNHGKEKP